MKLAPRYLQERRRRSRPCLMHDGQSPAEVDRGSFGGCTARQSGEVEEVAADVG